LFFKNENELVIKLENAVPGIGKASHDRSATGGIGCGDLLPDHRAHIVEPYNLTKLDDLHPDRNNLVPAIVNRTGKLVTDINAESAARMQHPLAFAPNQVQVVDIAFVTLVKADLLLRSVVLELPVGR